MDHLGVETTPERNSIHREEQHPLPSRKRKRKPQPEQLALPKSKHKFRHQLVPDDSSEDGMGESQTGIELHEGPEQTEGSSAKGGGSSSSGRLLEGCDSTMEDREGNGEMSPKIFVPRFEPSASPSGPQGNAFKDTLGSTSTGVIKDALDCQLPVFDADDGGGESGCRLPVPHVEEGEDEFMEEECLHGPTQELMLCCEDVGMHALGLSSAKWSIKQDALPGAERPTIDREFEQYFSVFML